MFTFQVTDPPFGPKSSASLSSPACLLSLLLLCLYYCMEGEFSRIKNIICLINLVYLSPGMVAFSGTTHLDALRLK